MNELKYFNTSLCSNKQEERKVVQIPEGKPLAFK